MLGEECLTTRVQYRPTPGWLLLLQLLLLLVAEVMMGVGGPVLVDLLVYWTRKQHSFQPDQLGALETLLAGPLEHPAVYSSGHKHLRLGFSI